MSDTIKIGDKKYRVEPFSLGNHSELYGMGAVVLVPINDGSTYYVNSAGEVIGPNKGKVTGVKNQQRQVFGNLFTNKKDAEIAARKIREALEDL